MTAEKMDMRGKGMVVLAEGKKVIMGALVSGARGRVSPLAATLKTFRLLVPSDYKHKHVKSL